MELPERIHRSIIQQHSTKLKRVKKFCICFGSSLPEMGDWDYDKQVESCSNNRDEEQHSVQEHRFSPGKNWLPAGAVEQMRETEFCSILYLHHQTATAVWLQHFLYSWFIYLLFFTSTSSWWLVSAEHCYYIICYVTKKLIFVSNAFIIFFLLN